MKRGKREDTERDYKRTSVSGSDIKIRTGKPRNTVHGGSDV